MSIATSHIKYCFTIVKQPTVIVLLIFCLMMSSCKKLVEIPPPSQSLAENNVYATDATAIGVLTGIYTTLTNDGGGYPFQGTRSIGLLAGLSADELSAFEITNPYFSYYRNDLNALTSGSEHWSSLYSYIFKYNAAIEGLMKSSTLTPAVKQQLLGEAKFMRAFSYFYLVNLFGDVPLALSTNAEANTLLPRAPKTEVYNQIITDLKDSKELLSTNYLDITLLKTTNERVRPTKWAAQALLARTYLYTGDDYAKAEEEATAVINNTTLFGPLSAIPLNDVFRKNSREAIWQLQPTTNDFNTMDGKMYVIPSTGPSTQNNPAFLSEFLQSSFEPGDQRAVPGNWINMTIYEASPGTFDTVVYPFKYKVNASPGITSAGAMTEYIMVLRLAEQYLIRAEARARLGDLPGAVEDLNRIRQRSGLAALGGPASQAPLLSAILHERQVELFTEWGHRWLDLKRTGNVDAVMSVVTPQKANGVTWQSYQQLYPLSNLELGKAPNLVQTPGY